MTDAHPDLIEAVDQLGPANWSGTAYRFTTRSRDPLAGHGAYLNGGRWNPREAFPCIYLAEPRKACLAEFRRRVEGQAKGAASFRPQLLHQIEVSDLRVLDLTRDGAMETVGLTLHEIRSDDQDACQAIGAAAHFLGLQGVRAPSATGVGRVLAAFERRLDPYQLQVTASEELRVE